MAASPIDADARPPFERVLTGIPGLDTDFARKLSQTGIYIVRGYPGTSKTRGWSAAMVGSGYSEVSPRKK